MNKPLVSICIPTYNRADYLVQTIESALAQNYDNLEIIVSDNHSTDNTQEVIKQFKIDKRFTYYYNERNVGMVNNWRLTLDSRVNGEWFLILSDDDYLINNSYISEAINIIQNNPDVNMVYANGYIEHTALGIQKELNLPYDTVEDGKNIFFTKHKVSPQAFTLCNILFNTDLAKKFNSFSNPHNLACDSELFLKTCLQGKVGVIKKYSSVYRLHGSNLITQKRTYEQLIALATDLLISPHILAQQTEGFTKKELDNREKEVVVPGLKDILFSISELDPKLLSIAVEQLSGRGIDINKFFHDPLFLIKLQLTKSKKLLKIAKKIKNIMR